MAEAEMTPVSPKDEGASAPRAEAAGAGHDPEAKAQPPLGRRPSNASSVASVLDLERQGFDGLLATIVKHIPEQPAVQVEFENLSYSVQVPLAEQTSANLGSAIANLVRHRKTKTKTVNILNKLSGVIPAGSSTLVMSPPGHGVSTFLKALAGNLESDKLSGKIWYAGKPIDEVNVHRLATYVDQDDLHLPQLTVRETFEFAVNCLVSTQALDKTMRRAVEKKPEHVIKLFGLSNAADTIVGDNLTRGVSGGEKKRVTLGEMIMGNARVHFQDAISTGLDSATIYEITRLMKTVKDTFGLTVVTSLLQPPPEVYNLFDRVILLRDGCIVYQGPRSMLRRYFGEMGLVCPEDTDEADWIIEFLTDPRLVWDAEVARMRAERDDPEYTPRLVPPLTTEELVLYLEASLHRGKWGMLNPIHVNTFVPDGPGAEETKQADIPDIIGEVCHPLDTACITGPAEVLTLDTEYKRVAYGDDYALGYLDQFKIVLNRSRKLVVRNKAFVFSNLFQAVFMGFVLGTLFFDVGIDEFQLRFGLLFFALLFLAFAGMAEIPIAITSRAVVYKQTEAQFYAAPLFTLSNTIAALPIQVVTTLIFGSMAYWLTGFVGDVGAFLFFLLVVFLNSLAFASLFRTVAYAMPDLAVAQSMSGPVVGVFMLFAGFLLTRGQISGVLIALYWFTPLSWAIRSLAHNEFKHSDYDEPLGVGGPRRGDVYLDAYEIQTDSVWKWAGVGYLCAFIVFAIVAQTIILARVRWRTNRSRPQVPDNMDVAPSLRRVDDDEEEEEEAKSGAPAPTVVHVGGSTPTLDVDPTTLVFKDLGYEVDIPKSKDGPASKKALLKGISGYALPGTMTALMGSSGAGKTTLMDVISGRKTGGTISGQIFVNGKPKDDEHFRRITGYCEQQDIHNPFSTVREALRFSAKTRLRTKLADDALERYIDNILDILELNNVADYPIGSTESGLPTGERKRVTIGVELVTNPSVIFLDEPTSGLDSRSAAIVMRVIDRIARSGRTVVCTIHQPSASIFFRFDQLLLLRRGGETVYFGDIRKRAKPLISYFESQGAKPLPKRTNPANWMLEVISPAASPDDTPKDFAAVYRDHQLSRDAAAKVDELMATKSEARTVTNDSYYATSMKEQMKLVFGRVYADYWRNVSYNYARLLVLTGLGLLFGIMYYDTKVTDFSSVSSLLGAIFVTTLFAAVINITTSLTPVITSRDVYYREQASRAYSPWLYAIAYGVIELPYTILLSIPFTTIFYWMAGLRHDFEAFIHFVLCVAALCVTFNNLGHLFASAAPNAEVAGIIQGLVISILNLFAGFFIPEAQMPTAWVWLYWANPVAHVLRAAIPMQFRCVEAEDSAGCNPIFNPSLGTLQRAEDYVKDFTGASFDDRWLYVITTLAFGVAYRILAMLAIRYINHLKR